MVLAAASLRSPAASGKVFPPRYSKTPAAFSSKFPLGKRRGKELAKLISERLWYRGR
jgi:hypothetical protein